MLTGVVGTTSVGASTDEYDTVLDIVDDLGADNTGNAPINDALAEAVEYESVKVVFPDGEYLIEDGPGGDGFARWDFGVGEEVTRVGKVALIGDGDVTLKPPEGGRHNILTLWGKELTIENFCVDQTAYDTSTGITSVAEDKLLVRDIYYKGKVTGDYVLVEETNDPRIPEDPNCLIPGLLEPDGTGLVENVRAPHGVESLSRKGAVWVNFLHQGDLLFNECEFSYFADNAIYGSPPGQGPPLGGGGSVRVENCFFKNNNVTAIRLGSPGSYAKNCTVVIDESEIPATPWGAVTSRAGWAWYDFDGYYQNIDVVIDNPRGEGILTYPTHTGSLDVINCRIEVNSDATNAVNAVPGSGSLTVKNTSVTGDAGGSAAITAANGDVSIQNLCVTQTGENRDGISLSNSSASIENARINVTGEQIVEDDASTVTVQNLRSAGRCPPAKRTHPLDSN